MKHRFISRDSGRRLIIIFTGWGMDWRPLQGLRRHGYDIAVVWDYRNCEFDTTFANGYSEICVVAWSLGVHAAAMTLGDLRPKVTKMIAVNGTMSPVDDSRGIPCAIFRGTLEGLDERNLTKFRRRMAGSREAFECFSSHCPERGLEELREELACFLSREPASALWDLAIIGRNDAIFPPANQAHAWEGTATETTGDAHLPDFQSILDRHIIDKELMAERFLEGRQTYDTAATVQHEIIDRMLSLVETEGIELAGANVLEVGCGTGLLSRHLHSLIGERGKLEMWDMVGDTPLADTRRTFRRGDAELMAPRLESNAYDMIISASTIQWFHSPGRFLH
ncbi:MAG: DUF452 family protein, partial [Muribaculaceae bacterium]|nr:DUF452 family protein [Muribaculaceae bacterium]